MSAQVTIPADIVLRFKRKKKITVNFKVTLVAQKVKHIALLDKELVSEHFFQAIEEALHEEFAGKKVPR